MPLIELDEITSRKIIEENQEVGRFAVGTLPYLEGRPLLVRRLYTPHESLYSLVTGTIACSSVSGDHPYYFLRVLQESKFNTDPRLLVEKAEWAALREMYEELYNRKTTVRRALSGEGDEDVFLKLKREHSLERVAEIVDANTGFLVSTFKCILQDSNFSITEADDLRPLNLINLRIINPLTQFILWLTGEVDGSMITHTIHYGRVEKIKGVHRYENVPPDLPAYCISY